MKTAPFQRQPTAPVWRAAIVASLAIAAIGLAVPRLALAHALMTAPKPRDSSDSHKDPNGPCGVNRTTSQPVTNPPLTPGAQLNVTWNETVNHPGCFVVDFSMANDTNFTVLATVAHKTGSLPRAYSAMVTLPSTPCTACTLRVRQIMLNSEPAAGACPPATVPSGATYYSCANVVLGSGGGDAGVPDGGTPADAGGGSGGRAGTDGATASGGRGADGGLTGTGGAPSTGSGGTPSTGSGGGVVASGGRTGSGGSTAAGTGGGASNTGGAVGSGGGPAGGVTVEPESACSVGPNAPAPLAVAGWLSAVLLGLAARRLPKKAQKKPRTTIVTKS